ncbi:MAG: cytochrome b N-terminal domain-containing protein [Deltaproteobacteria bacterium]|nr:cytochrome b N-terminal domain-containing protein [Deltaproteobacteria bacterium]
MHRLSKWVQERLGWKDIRETLLDRKIPSPGRWGWLYTLGSATLAVFILQVVTGTLLGMNYSPSPDHAYDSIRYIMTQVPMGSLIRGLHKWGATAMIVLLLLHMLRIYVMASYKRPREITWMVGIILLLVGFGLGFTGYLLPWDQKAYWATAVGANIAAQAPFFGPMIAKILKGGEELGALTLTRFYGLHVLVLPITMGLLIGAHLFLVIYHGISAPPSRKVPPPDYQDLKAKGKPFYPHSIFKDVVMVLIVFAIIFFLALHYGAGLEDPVNPNDTSYNPRPEWYFLFLFQMLKLFPGKWEPIAAVVIPTLIVAFLFFLPLLDRREDRHPLARPFWMGIGSAALFFVIWLSYQGWKSPLLNPQIEKNPMVLQGKKLYDDLRCSYCHSMKGEGGTIGPDLIQTVSTRSDEWIMEHFKKPRAKVAQSMMPELNLLDEEIQALIAYLREVGGGGASVTSAMKIYVENCQDCHRLGKRGEDVGPNLSQIGSFREASWIQNYISNPKLLNPDSVMPEFGTSLSKEEIENMARFLAGQKGMP